MSQTSYDLEQGEAYAGMKVDSRFDTVESKLAEAPSGEVIPFGYGLQSGNEDAVNQVRIPSATQSVLTTDIPLEASNSTVITVNGDALTAVVYATSDAATMAAVVAMILTHEDVLSAVLTSARVITVIGVNGLALTITGVTTGGTNQAVWTPVASDPGVFRGISVHRHVEKTAAGIAAYNDKDAVDTLRVGEIWMPYVDAATPVADETLYINLAITAEAGKATNVSSDNIATGGVIREVDTTNKLLKANINLP